MNSVAFARRQTQLRVGPKQQAFQLKFALAKFGCGSWPILAISVKKKNLSSVHCIFSSAAQNGKKGGYERSSRSSCMCYKSTAGQEAAVVVILPLSFFLPLPRTAALHTNMYCLAFQSRLLNTTSVACNDKTHFNPNELQAVIYGLY